MSDELKNENPEEVPQSDDPVGLLHQRLGNTITAFLSEYDSLDLADVVATLEKIKFDIFFDISWQQIESEEDCDDGDGTVEGA